jgi:hypothetical protein
MPKRKVNVRVLQDWDVYLVELPGGKATVHVVGRMYHYKKVVVTESVVLLAPWKRRFKTNDGKTFEFGHLMQGSPECDSVWARWLEKNGAQDAVRVTIEIRDFLPKVWDSFFKRGPRVSQDFFREHRSGPLSFADVLLIKKSTHRKMSRPRPPESAGKFIQTHDKDGISHPDVSAPIQY